MRKKFGQVLLEQGLITPAQLADALTYQGRNGMRLGQALVARGHITEDQLVITLGQALSTRVVDLARVQPDSEALDMVRPAFASEHDLFPISVREVKGAKQLTVAVADPLHRRGVDELAASAGIEVEAVLAKSTAIDMAIRRHYGPRIENHAYGVDAGEARNGASSHPALTGSLPASDEIRAMASDNASVTGDTASIDTGVTAPIPLTQVKRSGPTGFDAELGALLDAAGDAVQEEAIGRLERRFWALMRVLAKKGLVNNEEFLRELNEEEATFRSQ